MVSFPIEVIECDVAIVGAGGAGLRAALEAAKAGAKVAVISKVHPLQSHTAAAQGGINAPLGNRGKDDWRWLMYDTVRGGDWLGDQDAIEFLCRHANEAILELEHYGVPFTRSDDGAIYQRAYGGQSTEFGKGGMAYRACAAADRTGHAILYALHQQCLKLRVPFYNEHMAFDLIMADGSCQGVVAYGLEDGIWRIFRAPVSILATGGYGQVYAFTTAARICTGDGNAMILRAGLPLQDMEFVQFHPTGIYGAGCLLTEGARGEGGYLVNAHGERFMERYAPKYLDLASRDVISRAIAREIAEGRGCGPKADHVHLRLDHLPEDVFRDKLPTVREIARTFAGVDVTRQPIPVVPTVHYTMGGIPTTWQAQVVTHTGGVDSPVPGLLAIGEAACASVHGANRLGCNSLLDLIVFGKAAGMHAAEQARTLPRAVITPATALEPTRHRLNAPWQQKSGPTIAQVRQAIQQPMQQHANLFRNQYLLSSGIETLQQAQAMFNELGVRDSSSIWNTSLVEREETGNLLAQAHAVLASALHREESRGAHWREDFPARDDIHWLTHTLAHVSPEGVAAITHRPVNLSPTSADTPAIPPEERAY